LASIYEAAGDKEKSISLLKAAIKENYDPDKEGQLEKLGGKLTYADMPELNYPMQKRPIRYKCYHSIISGRLSVADRR
jgi:hypothetical protein